MRSTMLSAALLAGSISVVHLGAAQRNPGSADPRVISYQLPRAEATLGVAPAPRLDLGSAGTEAETFSWIVAVRQQASGRILVATFDPIEIRVFERDGRLVATFGRKGQGPGEYLDISDLVVLPRDSLVVLDRMQRRISILGPDGNYASSFSFKAPFATSPFDVSLQPLLDGTLLIGYAEVTATQPSPDPVSVYQYAGRYSTAGVRIGSVAKFFAGEYFLQATPGGYGGGSAFWDRAFGRRGTLLATGESILAGDASTPEIRRYSPTGALLEIHQVPLPTTPITAVMIARYRTEALAKAKPTERAIEERRVGEMPYPTQLPAYRRFLEDAKGRIWLQLYGYPMPAPNRWVVLDPATRQARAVLLPDRFHPYVIGAREILGTWQDADDVEHVRAYRLLF